MVEHWEHGRSHIWLLHMDGHLSKDPLLGHGKLWENTIPRPEELTEVQLTVQFSTFILVWKSQLGTRRVC